MKIFLLALALFSTHAFAGNKYPALCLDVCAGSTLNATARSEVWQMVEMAAQMEHPGQPEITPATTTWLNFLGRDLGLELESYEYRVRKSDNDKCTFMSNDVAMNAARLQAAKSYYTAGTALDALVKIVSAERCN